MCRKWFPGLFVLGAMFEEKPTLYIIISTVKLGGGGTRLRGCIYKKGLRNWPELREIWTEPNTGQS